MVRNFGLDIMRAFSIWLVLLQHGGINIPGLAPLQIGGIGVEVFFVLSGFLIGGILFREIEKGKTFKQTLQSFWIRRWFRILPLYYAVLLFKFILIDNSIGWNILYYVFFLQNNFYGIQYFGVSWSLVIEEWFYIFTPIFLLLSIRFLKTDKRIFSSMVAFIVFVNIIRLIYVLHGNVPYSGVNSSFPFRFDSLFLGVILSFAKHKKWKLFSFMATAKCFALGIVLFVAYIFYLWSLSYNVSVIVEPLLTRTLGFFILPFTVSLTIPFMSQIKFNVDKNFLQKAIYFFITTTSVLTYSLYLTHMFIFSYNLSLPLAIMLTYLVSWLIYMCFEKPILNYRDKITAKEKAI